MKPYGREKFVNGSGHKYGSHWKKDYHCHDKNHRKLESWWEVICDFVPRSTMKQRFRKETEDEL